MPTPHNAVSAMSRPTRARQSAPAFRSRAERAAAGKALRGNVPRKDHATWKPRRTRHDPIDVLEESNRGRLRELVPIRYGRMLKSPFTFLRGAAALMAYDLAETPTTRIKVQACGDCHLLNFGLFATPERHLVFDVNDFDETLPAPWEWDLKRLTASFVIAARDHELSDARARDAVMRCVQNYREHLSECSKMNPLQVWYQRLDAETLIANVPDAEAKRFRERIAKEARERVLEHHFPGIADKGDGHYRLVDHPPLVFHATGRHWNAWVEEWLAEYRRTLSDERRVLFDRYRFEDSAMKVVGVGSVGTRCFIGLFFAADDEALILQFKEARRSVLEPYAGKSKYANQGERVVTGQRLMQSSSDIFLGWARGRRGFDFYVRQLRDMKMSIPVEGVSAAQLERYAQTCGWTLARVHAKSGDAATISGYMGKSKAFDKAIAKFALLYADQTERDHAALVKAVRSGRIKALVEEG
jgi:uncharacterized protein (DUF2252 family)